MSVIFGAYQVADFFTDNDDPAAQVDSLGPLTVLQTSTGTFVYAPGSTEENTVINYQDRINVFSVASDGALTFLQAVSPLDSNVAPDVDHMELVTVGTRNFLYVHQTKYQFFGSILTYEIGEDGRMTYLRETEASPEMPFFGDEGMASFTMGGETFLYARGVVGPFSTTFVQTLNIFRVGADGGLAPVSWSGTGTPNESAVGVTVGGNTYLIENAVSLITGSALLVHRVFPDGTTALVETVQTRDDPLIGLAHEMNVVTVGATTFVVTTSWQLDRLAVNVMTLDAAGQLTSVVQPQIVQDRLLGASPATTVVSFGGETFITVINPATDFRNFDSYQPMLLLYRLTEAGLLEPVSEMVLPDGWSPTHMELVLIDGQPVLIASNSGIPERVETFLLGGGDDTLTGEAGDDHIFGFSGDDVLSGLDGNDTLEGGAGNDTLNGNAGVNALYGGDGDDLVQIAVTSGFVLPIPVADGGAGIDTLDISQTGRIAMVNLTDGQTSTSVLINASTGDVNFLTGPVVVTGFENVTGGAFAERLSGNAAANHLIGAGGADTILGRDGDDSLDGGDDHDLLWGGAGNDTLLGGTGNDTLNGDDGVNALYGGDGDDLVVASVSSGLVIPRPVADGGAGIDTLDISQTGRMAMVNLNNGLTSSSILLDGTSIIFLNGPMSATGFENVIGGAAAERFLGSNATNHLTGAGGNDTLHGIGGDDVIDGGAGNDVIDGGLGHDVMRGGDGNDIYVVDAAGDLVQEAALVAGAPATGGVDSVHSAVTINLNAHAGVRAVENLVLTGTQNINGVGNGLANLMIGNAGNNVLNGGLGHDVMRGGDGNDIYVVDAAGDLVQEAALVAGAPATGGVDSVHSAVTINLNAHAGVRAVENLVLTGTQNINGVGNGLANLMIGNAGNNVLNGGLGHDVMRGGDGNDIYVVDAAGDLVQEAALVVGAPATGGIDVVHSAVTTNLNAHAAVRAVENLVLTGTQNINGVGNGLANLLIGNAGNNVLNGGLGNDVMRGGGGSDTFVFHTTLSATNVDRIVDFNVMDDLIRLDDAVFVGLISGALAGTAFAANPGGAATDAQDRIIYETDTGRLSFDADGNGAGAQVHFATLNPNLILTSEDVFVF